MENQNGGLACIQPAFHIYPTNKPQYLLGVCDPQNVNLSTLDTQHYTKPILLHQLSRQQPQLPPDNFKPLVHQMTGMQKYRLCDMVCKWALQMLLKTSAK